MKKDYSWIWGLLIYIVPIGLLFFLPSTKSESKVEYASYYKDGVHTASVSILIDTALNGPYLLDVELRNDSVIKIRFPNYGILTDDTIEVAALDTNIIASTFGKSGRGYVLK